MKVLLVENIHPNAKDILEKNGFEVRLLKDALSEVELLEMLPAYQILGIRSKTRLTEKVLLKNSHLKAISCFCIGTDQVDLDAARKLSIPVFNAPTANSYSVVEWVIAHMLILSRGFFEQNQNMHAGIWSKSSEGKYELRGKTLGIVGYGNIGSQLSLVAEALGMKVIYFDIETKQARGKAQAKNLLGEVLKEADFISLHVPETYDTRLMIGKSQLSLMKKNACLLNSSRGSVIQLDDLAVALKKGLIAGCAIDVFPQEPATGSASFHSVLSEIKNTLLTPHIGGSTEEAQKAVSVEVVQQLLRHVTPLEKRNL